MSNRHPAGGQGELPGDDLYPGCGELACCGSTCQSACIAVSATPLLSACGALLCSAASQKHVMTQQTCVGADHGGGAQGRGGQAARVHPRLILRGVVARIGELTVQCGAACNTSMSSHEARRGGWHDCGAPAAKTGLRIAERPSNLAIALSGGRQQARGFGGCSQTAKQSPMPLPFPQPGILLRSLRGLSCTLCLI